MNWYLEVLRKYAVFEGRAGRSEYWYFMLFNIIISIVLAVIAGALGLADDRGNNILSSIYALAVLIPGIAVTVRRLHDTGKSGWFILLGLIPCVGGIILLVFMIQGSDFGANEYGEDPNEMSIG